MSAAGRVPRPAPRLQQGALLLPLLLAVACRATVDAPEPAPRAAPAPERDGAATAVAAGAQQEAAQPAPEETASAAAQEEIAAAPETGVAGAAAAPPLAADRALRGFIRSRYRFRSTGGENDHDLETRLVLDVLDDGKSPVSGHLDLWTNADLDESGSSSEPDPFFDLSDTYDSSLTARLYQAYVDVAAVEELDVLRVGRQPLDDTPEFVTFDGVRLETGDLGDDDWRIGAYGGVPTHFFESSPEGDSVFGGYVEARPWDGTRARLDYMHLEDDDLLGEHRNDLLAANAWHTAGRLRLIGSYSMLEGESRDVAARANWYDPGSDLLLQGSYYQLLETQKDLVTELDPFYEALLEYYPFVRAELLIAKGFAERYHVEVGGELRQLVDEADEGEFNHEYSRTHAQLEVDRIANIPLSAALTGEIWNSDDGKTTSWSFDLTREWDERLRTSLGTYFALYDFDLFTFDEREDVRVYYIDMRYDLTRRTRLDLVYEFENDDLDEYHTLRGGILWRF